MGRTFYFGDPPPTSLDEYPFHPIEPMVQTFCRITEEWLGRSWLNAGFPDSHPARRRWTIAKRVQERGIKIPEDDAVLPELGRLLLDSYAWARGMADLAGAETAAQLPNLVGPGKATAVAARLADAQQYEDVLVELSTGLWYRINGWGVEFLEQEGMPDLAIASRDQSVRLSLECKRLRSVRPRKIGKALQDANRQLRNVEPGSIGFAVLDVTRPLVQRSRRWEETPAWVELLADEAELALAVSKNRAVAAAVIVWDEFLVLMEKGNQRRANIIFRRRPLVVPHRVPHRSRPDFYASAAWGAMPKGYTMTFQIAARH